jgi:hypothetical protein
MISIETNDKVSRLVVEVYIPGMGMRVWTFDLMAHDHPWESALWTAAARKSMKDRLRSIREKAYGRGWADAKAKRAKSNWQSQSFDDM